MEFTKLIRSRYSVRAYKPDPVEDDKLQKVLEAARLAPTAANRQPFQIIVAHTTGREAELEQVYHREWFLQAPLVLLICGLSKEAWVRRDGKCYQDADAAIVMTHIILAAAEQDLGTCIVAAFDPLAAREVFGLPGDVEPLLLTPLGYPNDLPLPKERKQLADLVRWEHW